MKYYLAKILQILGLFLTVEGLYIGIRYDGMRTELMLLLAGIALFYGGRRLESGVSS